jgi:hypothetical protein
VSEEPCPGTREAFNGGGDFLVRGVLLAGFSKAGED